MSLLQRLGFSYLSKYILLSKLPGLAFPAAVLIGVSYYQRQRSVLELREQQRAAELEALKNQLNPHFIFNTLNNIYSLAVQRSPLTAEAVARLSSILDYVLHSGSKPLVSVREEVSMIEAYLALEKLRFGDRLVVEFTNTACADEMVPPLLFLTLLENAFKHGAAKSLGPARITIALTRGRQQLCFEVCNTVATESAHDAMTENAIGLNNLRRQLALQCPDTHRLTITRTEKLYTAQLVLNTTCHNAIPASSSTMKPLLAS
jgi:LytS/YehU family sensor histidine kinase